jgi:hydroxymethylpyrimidine/phosphomethylpyrimidine kinase
LSRRRIPAVVAIGGFDPSGGAGVVADARSIEAMGAVPLAVATSITVQSGTGVKGFRALPPSLVLAQLDELLAHLPVAAVKIGQVPSAALARRLARRLTAAGVPLVLDPVLEASGGGSLASAGTAAAVVSALVPIAALVTVNLHEAAVLTGGRVTGLAGMRRAAQKLEELGAAAVLVKGGHLRGDPVDLLWRGGRGVESRARRLAGSMHGTGCALASAAAARIALGDDVDAAVRRAREHVRSLLGAAITLGAARLRPPR